MSFPFSKASQPMTRNTAATASLALAATLLAGCSVNSDPAFRDVQSTISAHTGGKSLHWMRGTSADAETERRVKTLLSRELTARSAAQIALLHNRSIQATLEELGIAQADYLQAVLPSNPNFSGFARFPNGGAGGTNVETQVATNILDLLLIPLKRKMAARQLEAVKLQVAAEVLGVVSETKMAFYTLQARQQMLKRLDLIAETNEAGLDVTQRQHEAGNITDLDLANQQALYSQSRADRAQTSAQIRSDRERLTRLMGVWGADLKWRVGDQLPAVPTSEVSLANLEKRAISERLDVAMARQNVASVGYALKLRGGTRFLPAGINVGVNSERESDRTRLTGPTLDVQLPIFDFGQAAIPKLQAQYRQAQHELEALAVNARSEVREARDMVLANREQANFYRKTLLPQRLQIVNQTQLHFNAMQVGPLDLFAAKERELRTERDYIETWRDYWIARVELERALIGSSGGGGRKLMRGSSGGSGRMSPMMQGGRSGTASGTEDGSANR